MTASAFATIATLDREVLAYLNGFVGRSTRLDHLLVFLAGNSLFKADVVAGVFWWHWFRVRSDIMTRRATLLAVMASGLLAVVIGRWLAVLLPFRARPIHDLSLGLHVAAGMTPAVLQGWSSFPSDHAMMFVAVAAGFFAVSRPTGALLLLHAFAVVCLPRVMLGLHYPSDTLAGAVTGSLVALVLTRPPVRDRLAHPLLRWLEKSPSWFYALAILASIEVASMMESSRDLLVTLFRLIRPHP